jgi:hypothetical protein
VIGVEVHADECADGIANKRHVEAVDERRKLGNYSGPTQMPRRFVGNGVPPGLNVELDDILEANKQRQRQLKNQVVRPCPLNKALRSCDVDVEVQDTTPVCAV